MTRIALVVSDVDGTLLTKDKTLTDKTARAVRQLEDSGVGFTIVSSRPTIGMRFLVEPLRITLPVGSFNGSSISDPQMNPIEQHLIPASCSRRTADAAASVRVLSLVNSVPSTSETTSAMRVMSGSWAIGC